MIYDPFKDSMESAAMKLALLPVAVTNPQSPVQGKALIGFKSFDDARDFSHYYHLRLVVLSSCKDGWQETGNIPCNDLSPLGWSLLNDYEVTNKYLDDFLQKAVEFRVKELRECGTNEADVNKILQNYNKALTMIMADSFPSCRYLVLDKNDFHIESELDQGTELSFGDHTITIGVMAADNGKTHALESAVLAGMAIPCTPGQMPEDYIYLAPKHKAFCARCEDEASYEADNNSDNSRYLGPFFLYDIEGCIGYAYRETYDDRAWRWSDGEHMSFGSLLRSTDSIMKYEDDKFTHWQLPARLNFYGYSQIPDEPIGYNPGCESE